ncbi:MAG: DUF6265 family protein [Myxococcaceae bacterium]
MIPAIALWLAAAPADVVKEIEVRASPGDVWKAWTTSAGARTFFAPEAKIEAKPGGAYEIGDAERCTVVSAEPLKKLQLICQAQATVTIELFPQGKTVKVRLTQIGRKDESAGHAWDVALARLAHRFRRAPIDWKSPWAPVPPEALHFLEGIYVSPDGQQLETWTWSEHGLLGSAREDENGKPVFYELAAVEPQDGEWVMTIRMFKAELAVHPKTEHETARLVLDSLSKDRAVFVTEFGDPVSVEYLRSGDGLDVNVKRGSDEEKHHFKRKDAGH